MGEIISFTPLINLLNSKEKNVYCGRYTQKQLKNIKLFPRKPQNVAENYAKSSRNPL